jgi:cytochrome c peroxidase
MASLRFLRACLRFLRACILTSIALLAATALSVPASAQQGQSSFQQEQSSSQGPRDPGVRGGAPGAGGHLPGLTRDEIAFFELGLEDFAEAEGVGDGLGPRFNADGCGTCHSQPAVGGTSPAVNPLVDLATLNGAKNVVPSFIRRDGPIREARFVKNPDGTPDGGVHNLFVISGRVDPPNDEGEAGGNASGCNIRQEDFERQVANRNIIFRIPTPVFGSGLMEMVKDSTLVNNVNSNSSAKQQLGISGRLNRNGNDGTVSRFGWKAQNQSLLIFSSEAYNVEMGITNEGFQSERDEDANCQFASVPNDTQLFDTKARFPELITAIENFANFQRFLDQPNPVTSFQGASSDSIRRGKDVFSAIGCALCHTPKLTTSDVATVAALKNKDANLFSDIALHNMGRGLEDGVAQGGARGNEFRTSPLWGLGQRIFFLHDGRTKDLRQAIREHESDGSEANAVIGRFRMLGDQDEQHLLNFLRSL